MRRGAESRLVNCGRVGTRCTPRYNELSAPNFSAPLHTTGYPRTCAVGGGTPVPVLTTRRSQSVMTRETKWDKTVLVQACTKNTSRASTGPTPLWLCAAKNGLAVAVVNVLATRRPTVAWRPMSVAPQPRMLRKDPAVSRALTSSRVGSRALEASPESTVVDSREARKLGVEEGRRRGEVRQAAREALAESDATP